MVFVVCVLAALHISSAAQAGEVPKNVEDVLVVRSLRETRIPAADFCRQAPADFGGTYEDTYSLQSIEVSSTTGRVSNTAVAEIGRLRGCFGKTAEPGVSGFFAIGSLAGVSFRGLGDCRTIVTGMPETGFASFRCYLRLTELPTDYIGGVLTTNTLNSRRLVGLETDPPGYTQPSIATIRLWRKPAD